MKRSKRFCLLKVLSIAALVVSSLPAEDGRAQEVLEIISQPRDVTVAIGGDAVLGVNVASPNGWPVFYQWQKDGTLLATMTNSVLKFQNVQPCQSGSYCVIVSNEFGRVTSTSAVLSVVGIASWGMTDYGEGSVPPGLTNVVGVGAAPSYTVALKADGTLTAAGWNDQGELNIPSGLRDVTAIAVGAHHSLALLVANTLVQWGSTLSGQGSVPAGLSNVVAIAAGSFHSLALKADNTVTGWGYNLHGESAVPQDLSGVVAVAGGYSHSLALKVDGTVVAWSDNTWGQCTVPNGLRQVVAIAAGQSHNLALRADGTVVAWGQNDCGQAIVPSGLTGVIAIAAGGFHSLALKADGTVVEWGLVTGLGRTTMPCGLDKVVAIDAVSQHSVALVGNGPPVLTTLPIGRSAALGTFSAFRVAAAGAMPLSYQWRFNGADLPGATNCILAFNNIQAEQAGLYSVLVRNPDGELLSPEVPLTVKGIAIASQPQAQKAYLNGNVTLSIDVAGQTPFKFQWSFKGLPLPGANQSTLVLTNVQWSDAGEYSVEVSNPFGTLISLPARVRVSSVVPWGYGFEGKNDVPEGMTNVVAIAEGGEHVLALQADGTVRAWGANRYGQADVPTGLSNVIAIAAGEVHSVALETDGTVVTWGDTIQQTMSVPAGLSNVVAISAGSGHVLALKADATVVSWGYNFEGATDVPAGLRNVVAVSAGYGYSVALRADGSLVGWGSRWLESVAPPSTLQEIVAINAGNASCLALRQDGTVLTWGFETGNHLNMPADLADVAAIAAGDYHYLALKIDGTIAAWGYNSCGQGIVPIGLPPMCLVAAGRAHSMALVGTGAPFLISSPVSCAGGLGTAVGFRALATGAWPLSYQWRFNGMDLPGATHCVLWLTNLQTQLTGAYSVCVSNAFGQVISSEAHLQVEQISITSQPESRVTYQGGTVRFGVAVAAQGPISYQWLFDGADIAGAASNTLNLTNLQPEHAGRYSVRITNPFGSAVSGEASLTILPVLITAQPISRQILAGRAVSFSVAVDGVPPFTYQWQLNGTDLQGMTNATLTLENVRPNQIGAYSVAVSSAFGKVISAPGTLYVLTIAAWGGDSQGQIDIPVGLTNVIAIAGGGDYTLALKGDGTVAAWGDVRYGQTNAPIGLSNVIAIARGAYHNVALRVEGRVVAWGDNTYGQTNTPAGLSEVTAISAGAYHNLALRADGTVVGWGDNRKGQTSVPSDLSDVVAIAGVADYTLALRVNGTVAAWGDNSSGQTNVPVDLTNVVAISGEATHALALRLDGTIVSWGDGGIAVSNVPPDLTNIVAISGGQAHDLALRVDGTVLAWGDNSQGQAVVPEGLTNVVAIAGGREHTLALLSDGAPQITVQPWDQRVAEGGKVIVATKAVGAPPLNYQWQLNGVDIPGATGQTYSIVQAHLGDAGAYSAVVSNQLGTTSSRKNKLSVVSPSARFVPGSVNRSSDGCFRLSISAVSGSRIEIQASADLVHWETLCCATNTDSIFSFSDPDTRFRCRFYRIRAD